MSELAIPVSCNRDCLSGCPLLAYVQDGRITRIGNNPMGGPYMTGCVKGFQATRLLYAPDRLDTPLVRNGPRGSGQFRAASWDEALDLAAARLSEIKARYGSTAILRLGGSGSCQGAVHNTSSLTSRFLSLLDGPTETRTSYSSAATGFTTPFILGTDQAGFDAGTLAHSQMIVLWGANVVDCRFGADIEARLREARGRGVPIVVVDPRRTATAQRLGTQWIPVRPGTDSALFAAVLYVLLREDLADVAFAARYAVGFDALAARLTGEDGRPPCTPEWAESVCGTPAETIVAFARQYGRTHPVALFPGLAMQRTWGGEEAVRLAIALQVATGNLGVRGGSSGAFAQQRLPHPRMGGIPSLRNSAHPGVAVYRWPDAVLQGRAGGYPTDIHAIYSVGGNFAVQGADTNKSLRALRSVEFSICHEHFLTPTAAECDIVLPATHWLERQDILFSTGNYLFFTNRAVAPKAGCRDDYAIFAALAERLRFGEAFTEGKDEEAWLRSLVAASEVPDYDEFRRTGIYLGADQMRTAFSDFIADPVGHPLATPSGKVELVSAVWAERTGFSALPEPRLLPADGRYPLRLITPKPHYRVHSQGASQSWFREREPQRLQINPVDATARGLRDGDEALIANDQGRIRLAVQVTDDMMPGVVCLLEGVWPEFDAQGVDTAGSANVLTSTEPTLPSQGSRTHSVWVEVGRTG